MQKLPSLKWQNRITYREAHAKGETKRRARYAKNTYPRDGTLSVSNPTRALDTLSGYHGKKGNGATAHA